jgi:hypothetical protein
MIKLIIVALALLAVVSGCATGTASRGGTLLAGLNQYQGEMQLIGNQLSRWPERQQAAGTLKTVITGTVGASPEFYRLVDLDLRKREFTVTMREDNLRPDRVKEMKDELVSMDEEVAALKPVIKTQLSALTLHEPGEQIDNVATLGMLGIALDGFSSSGAGRGSEAPSTKVGQYVVTDLGGFSTVRAPDGKMFRCGLFGNYENGGGVKCEPAK